MIKFIVFLIICFFSLDMIFFCAKNTKDKILITIGILVLVFGIKYLLT